MPQLNPSPWFFVMITTWITMILLITKLTNTQTHTAPSKMNKPDFTQPNWPW